MARFFIDRPIFAWVVALFIIVAGAVAITQLPVAQYPSVAPPTINISATYPGASAKTMDESVLSVIGREMNGSPGLAYMESTSQADGTGQIALSFEPGTDPDLAQVDVQNRLSRASPRLPSAVTQQGVRVDKASSNFLAVVTLASEDGKQSIYQLGDYVSRNVLPEIQSISGVGQAQLFAAEAALRIWLDPAKMAGYQLSTDDVIAAVRAQNAQVASGSMGDLPNAAEQMISATVVLRGQLATSDEFREVVLRSNTNGSTVRLKDVARVELGIETYNYTSRLNGKPAIAVGIQLSPTGNALETAKLTREKMAELQAFFPSGVKWQMPYDSSTFVSISIEQVAHTLVEAVVLVFLVMFLFLQNWRYTLIPTLVVPIALLGTFAALLALGFSINVLTMFGMVLVIGIVVDDAIVVVENVERIMTEEGLSPLEATRKALRQISGAIVGITLVLVAVFVPLAFFSGSIGNIYRQFSATMVTSIAFSALLALSLTPALCATLLKPVEAGHHHEKKGFFGWFNRGFARTAKGYEGWVARFLKRSGRMMVVYLAVVAAIAVMYTRLPASFLPNEDQGFMVVSVQLPPGATQGRTLDVVKETEQYVMAQPEVRDVVSILGFSFTGRGQNAALMFVPLKHWSERKGEAHIAQAVAGRTTGELARIRDAFVFALSPPPIAELGNATGFTFRLQDRAGKGHEALVQARNQLLGAAMQSPILRGVRPDGLEDAPQLQIDIDRDKARALGVNFAAINSTVSSYLGSSYVNDFPSQGRLQRVMVQADAAARMQPEDLLKLNVVNDRGQLIPLSTFATTQWAKGAMQIVRYRGYPAMKIAGDAAPGRSTGEAMAEMERLAKNLPEGFGFEWTGQSREEKLAGSAGMVLYLFAILAVFLCLAALYESWSIPLAVILVVPLGVVGVVAGTLMRGMSNDVYFQIGLVTIIGLAAKNAILIIEFAKDLQSEGRSVVEAALEAAHLRFRPILMTSMAFILGVLPLYLATGASSASQRAIGTGVVGGMVTGTVLAVIFVPVFFVVVRSLFKGSERQRQIYAQHAHDAGIEPVKPHG